MQSPHTPEPSEPFNYAEVERALGEAAELVDPSDIPQLSAALKAILGWMLKPGDAKKVGVRAIVLAYVLDPSSVSDGTQRALARRMAMNPDAVTMMVSKTRRAFGIPPTATGQAAHRSTLARKARSTASAFNPALNATVRAKVETGAAELRLSAIRDSFTRRNGDANQCGENQERAQTHRIQGGCLDTFQQSERFSGPTAHSETHCDASCRAKESFDSAEFQGGAKPPRTVGVNI